MSGIFSVDLDQIIDEVNVFFVADGFKFYTSQTQYIFFSVWVINSMLHFFQARAGIDYESSYGKARPNDTILKLQRTTPYYKRNRAHVCSFYVRGECTRGAECPYRHEMPITGELSQQNIKDRYYGCVCLNLLAFHC